MQLSEIRNPNIEITNYVVSGISFLGEILVLITYCIVSEVRNLRSKLIVGLILSDIVATLANLTGSEISDEGSCIINGFLRQYGFTSSIVWVSIISYASRREVQNFGEDMSKLYTNFVLIAWMLPLLPTLIPLTGNATGWFPGYVPQFYWCSQNPIFILVNFYSYIVIGLVYILIQYFKMHKCFKQQAQAIGAEQIIELKRLFLYPTMLMISWIPALVHRILYAFGHDDEVLTFLHVLGSHSQGLTNSLFYLYSQRAAFRQHFAKKSVDQSPPKKHSVTVSSEKKRETMKASQDSNRMTSEKDELQKVLLI